MNLLAVRRFIRRHRPRSFFRPVTNHRRRSLTVRCVLCSNLLNSLSASLL